VFTFADEVAFGAEFLHGGYYTMSGFWTLELDFEYIPDARKLKISLWERATDSSLDRNRSVMSEE